MKPAPLWACVLCATVVGCSQFVIATAPVKQAIAQRSAASLQSDALFWDALHGGKYEQIPELLQQLTAVYLENPNDPVAAAHIGWLHIWRLAERARIEQVPATITDSIVLARKYFAEAVKMQPDEPRYLGFLASATMVEGGIHQDQRLLREGFFQMLEAIDKWPEFNLFTAGYVLSGQPADTLRYQQALAWQWQNLDVCAGERVDRRNPDYKKYMRRLTSEGAQRVCWNSWIAPHNFEGFSFF
jgi:hypothetical protein